jgi:hypothetical protein
VSTNKQLKSQSNIKVKFLQKQPTLNGRCKKNFQVFSLRASTILVVFFIFCALLRPQSANTKEQQFFNKTWKPRFLKNQKEYTTLWCKGKVIPVLNELSTTSWMLLGSGCIDPNFLDLGTSCRRVVSFTPLPLYLREKSPPYLLDRRLGGPQSRSWRSGEEKILDPTWTRTQTPRSSSP